MEDTKHLHFIASGPGQVAYFLPIKGLLGEAIQNLRLPRSHLFMPALSLPEPLPEYFWFEPDAPLDSQMRDFAGSDPLGDSGPANLKESRQVLRGPEAVNWQGRAHPVDIPKYWP